MKSFNKWLETAQSVVDVPGKRTEIIPTISKEPVDDQELGTAAPTIAPPKPGVKPTTPVIPQKPSRPDPFKPSKPKVVPGPKQSLKPLFEAYEDEVPGRVQDFWKDFPDLNDPEKKHIFHKHPIMRLYGGESSKKSFDVISDLANKAETPKEIGPMTINAISLLQQISMLERDHKEVLEDIAARVVSEIWGIDKKALDGRLTSQSGVEQNEAMEDPEDAENFDKLPQKVKDQIYKRISLNTITHGASMNAMYKAHHLAEKYLREYAKGGPEWAKQLISLYDKLIPSVHKPYWLFDIRTIAQLLPSAKVGSSRVDYPDNKDEDPTTQDNEGENPKVIARGLIFPILVHELIKGVLELISHHSLSALDNDVTRNVIKYGDRATDEIWLLQVGVHLWRRFLEYLKKIKDKPSLARILQVLYEKDPKEVHEILMAVLDRSTNAEELLNRLVSEA